MIEIGKRRIVAVKTRDKATGKLVPRRDEHNEPVTRVVSDSVYRVTRDSLSGHFCRDSGRKLVVGLIDGDLLELRPQGTRQKVHVALQDVYSYALRSMAARKQLERARQKKEMLKARRERSRINRIDRKLKKQSHPPRSR